MAWFFNKGGQQQGNGSPLDLVRRQYNGYRNNLLFLVLFTVINILFVLANVDYYMLFSASVPFYAVFLSMFFADKLPVDYYTDFETGEVFYFNLPGAEIFMGVAIAVAVIALAVYLLLWFLSKKSFVPLIVAEVLVVFDTLGLVVIAWLFGASSFLMDFVFHVVIMVFLGLAIYSGVKAKKLERLEKENGCATEEVQDGEVVLEVVPEAEATEVLEKTEE